MQVSSSKVLQLATALEEQAYAADPTIWAASTQGFTPDEWQAKFLLSKQLDIIINCSRQTGKTMMAGVKAAHMARYVPESMIVLVSHTQKQATFVQQWVSRATLAAQPSASEQVKWQTPSDRRTDFDIYEIDSTTGGGRIVNRSVLSMELANGSRVDSVPASSEAVRGYSPHMIIIDEAAYVPDPVYDSIRPMRAEHPVQLVLLSSAGFKRGFFYREWIGDDPDWQRIQVLADDCPRITPAFLAKERTKMTSEDMFLREYYCQFMEVSGGIFPSDQIDDIFMHKHAEVKPWAPELVVEGQTYGLELCRRCGCYHNPMDECIYEEAPPTPAI